MKEKKLDKIYIRDLLLRCIIGINPEERISKQDVLINVVLYTDLEKPSRTDNLSDSVDYKLIKKEIINLVENASFNLIEKLAGSIADQCIKHPKIEKVKVILDKPGALRFARSVAVEIFREKKGS